MSDRWPAVHTSDHSSSLSIGLKRWQGNAHQYKYHKLYHLSIMEQIAACYIFHDRWCQKWAT